MPRPATRTLTLALTLGLVFFGVSCSGGDGGGGPAPAPTVRATFVGFDLSALAASGFVRADYQITGPPGSVVDVLRQYAAAGGASYAGATQLPSGMVPTGSAPSSPGQITLPTTEGGGEVTVNQTFWWYAYADLGFFAGSFQFQITPNSPGLTSVPSTPRGVGFRGRPSAGGTGAWAGAGAGSTAGAPAGATGSGRAGHTATATDSASAGAWNVLVAGGYTDATGANTFDSDDRFRFSSGAGGFAHSVDFEGTTPVGRGLHASSFFIDPSNGAIQVLTTGGVDQVDGSGGATTGSTAHASGDVYSFSPNEQVTSTSGPMGSARYGHSATWHPKNEVIIAGGCSSTTAPLGALGSVEKYDPATNSFAPMTAAITARCGHGAALMSDGRIFIAGGEDPDNPGTLPCEIIDPVNDTVSTAAGGATTMIRVDHSVTRMSNGWILVVGGRSPLTGTVYNDAMVYKPESDSFSTITMTEARAMHSAAMLGDNNVLVTGGVDSSSGFTSSATVFTIDGSTTAGFTSATIYGALLDARGDHTTTASAGGAVFVIGGRNGSSTGSFLDSIDFFAFSNEVPAITSAMTSASAKPSGTGSGATMNVDVAVTDADQDGGYVIIRYASPPGSDFCPATIICQTPSSSTVSDYPNMQVGPGNYTFTWDYTADGVVAGSPVQIEVIPVGAVIGSPLVITGNAQ